MSTPAPTLSIVCLVAATDTTLPAGVSFATLDVVVTDFLGIVQTQKLTAAPWSATFTGVAAGVGSATANAVGSLGEVLGTFTQSFDAEGGTTTLTFPNPTGITVSMAA